MDCWPLSYPARGIQQVDHAAVVGVSKNSLEITYHPANQHRRCQVEGWNTMFLDDSQGLC